MNAFLSFVPQLLSIVIYSPLSFSNLPLSMFLQTLSFVALNKVCTSQYFLWWIVLLPLVLCDVNCDYKRIKTFLAALLFVIIFKGVWLFWAYQLEFRGYNTFLMLLYSSALFLIAQMSLGWATIMVFDNKSKKS